MSELKEICGKCKWQKICPQAWSFDRQDLDDIDQLNCGSWEEEVELTDEEKAGIEGDRRAHEIMVEGREIE